MSRSAARFRRDVPWPGAAPLVAIAALATAGCGGPSNEAGDAIVAFLDAVQLEQMDRLFCLSAGAAESEELGADPEQRREEFARWARAEYDGYLDGRDDGQVALDGHGIRAVKLFGLGKGTFYDAGPAQPLGDDAVVVRTELRFGYGSLDLSRLSPGTTFYLCTVPAGRVHAVRVPAWSQEVRLEVLDRLGVDWTLVRRSPTGSCGAGWAVAGVEPVPGSAVTSEITWMF